MRGPTILCGSQPETSPEKMMEMTDAVETKLSRHSYNLGPRFTQKPGRPSQPKTIQEISRRFVIIFSEGLTEVAGMAEAMIVDPLHRMPKIIPPLGLFPQLSQPARRHMRRILSGL